MDIQAVPIRVYELPESMGSEEIDRWGKTMEDGAQRIFVEDDAMCFTVWLLAPSLEGNGMMAALITLDDFPNVDLMLALVKKFQAVAYFIAMEAWSKSLKAPDDVKSDEDRKRWLDEQQDADYERYGPRLEDHPDTEEKLITYFETWTDTKMRQFSIKRGDQPELEEDNLKGQTVDGRMIGWLVKANPVPESELN